MKNTFFCISKPASENCCLREEETTITAVLGSKQHWNALLYRKSEKETKDCWKEIFGIMHCTSFHENLQITSVLSRNYTSVMWEKKPSKWSCVLAKGEVGECSATPVHSEIQFATHPLTRRARFSLRLTRRTTRFAVLPSISWATCPSLARVNRCSRTRSITSWSASCCTWWTQTRTWSRYSHPFQARRRRHHHRISFSVSVFKRPQACKYAMRVCAPVVGSEQITAMFQNHLHDDKALHYGEFINDLTKYLVSSAQSNSSFVKRRLCLETRLDEENL